MRRRYLAFFFVGLGVLLLVFAVGFLLRESPQEAEQPDVLSDTLPPSTAIFFPQDKSWHSKGFLATIFDSDLGSGFAKEHQCQYIIQDLGTEQAVGGVRPCQEAQVFVSVGQGQTCSSTFDAASFHGRCLLSSKAFDKAGNESSWKSAVFLIDLNGPEVGKASLPPIVQPGEEYIIEATVSDNGKITGCAFFIDRKVLEADVFLSPLPCQEGEACSVSFLHAFSVPGEYGGAFVCSDAAGNVASGESVPFRVFVNKSPEIGFCRVIPSRGDRTTEFRFEAQATDPDGDQLSFSWSFGDGDTSQYSSPLYSYARLGTFMPKVEVKDLSGATATCATAWVIVE